ncbi:MAG: hypothetical protein GX090_03765 [Firmicutes bacterium]|nr:hypothetical protein [Bacillota bacterium]
MKRLFTLSVIFILTFALVACNSDKGGNNGGNGEGEGLEGTLEEILERIYAYEGLSDEFKSFAKDGLIVSEITDENMEYHLGKAGLEFEEGIVSEPMIQPGAYALCLLRVGEGTDIEQLKQDIKDNVNPQKWVCVGVDPDNIIVDSIGDIVILIMSDTDAQDLHQAFLSLKN